MKTLADGDSEEAAVAIPVIVVPVEVQVALGAVPVEVGHIAVVVRVHPGGTVNCIRYLQNHHPLNILRAEYIMGVFFSSDISYQVVSFLGSTNGTLNEKLSSLILAGLVFQISTAQNFVCLLADKTVGCFVYFPKDSIT